MLSDGKKFMTSLIWYLSPYWFLTLRISPYFKPVLSSIKNVTIYTMVTLLHSCLFIAHTELYRESFSWVLIIHCRYWGLDSVCQDFWGIRDFTLFRIYKIACGSLEKTWEALGRVSRRICSEHTCKWRSKSVIERTM